MLEVIYREMSQKVLSFKPSDSEKIREMSYSVWIEMSRKILVLKGGQWSNEWDALSEEEIIKQMEQFMFSFSSFHETVQEVLAQKRAAGF